MRDEQDAYGHLVLDYLEGRPLSHELIERDDGLLEVGLGPGTYFAPVRRWPAPERRGLRFVRGRVLDAGVGAGRVALELQRRGHEVVGIDLSPLAVEVARRRGVVDARVLPFERVDGSLGTFGTVVMYGNNFGLFGSGPRARRLLPRLHTLTTTGGRIVAASLDPTATDKPEHLAYQARNRARGRMPGQVRIRIRHRAFATPWFDYLLVSPAELEKLIAGTGWSLGRLLRDEGAYYVAVLERD